MIDDRSPSPNRASDDDAPSERDAVGRLDPGRLVDLVGAIILSDPDAAAWQDPRFVHWLALAERRRAERRKPPLSDEEAAARGRALRARAYARASKVRLASGAPPAEAVAAAPVAEALTRAASRHAAPLVDLGVAAGVGRALWDEPVEAWIALPPELPAGRYLSVRIVGDSMAPVMHTGDVALLRVGPEVERGTMIVARHPEDGYVCKRVARIRRDRIELASLAPDRPLIVIPRDPQLVLGTVLLVWCSHRLAA